MVNISIYWTIVLIAKYIGAAALILLSGTHTHHTGLGWDEGHCIKYTDLSPCHQGGDISVNIL